MTEHQRQELTQVVEKLSGLFSDRDPESIHAQKFAEYLRVLSDDAIPWSELKIELREDYRSWCRNKGGFAEYYFITDGNPDAVANDRLALLADALWKGLGC